MTGGSNSETAEDVQGERNCRRLAEPRQCVIQNIDKRQQPWLKLDDRKFQGEDILVEDILAKAGVMQGDPVEIYSTT